MRTAHEAEWYVVELMRQSWGVDWNSVVQTALEEDDLYVTWTTLEEVSGQLDGELLDLLARHPTDAIRSLVARCCATPIATLEKLVEDEDYITREAAKATLDLLDPS